MINKTEDPDFVASWQKVEEALKRLDENQVERLFSKKHASLADFHQALIKELELKNKWHVSVYDKRVKTTYRTGTTQLSVECQHGQPVEFTLVQ